MIKRNSLQRHNADQTRSKILDAALKLFYEKGFTATSLSQIASLAQVNQSLIAHHFGNKQKLFQTVKMSIIPLEKIPIVNQSPPSLHIFLKEAIQQRLAIYEQSPSLHRLVSWEKLEAMETRKRLSGTELTIDPMQWLPPIEYLQRKKLLNIHYKPQLVFVWILYSVNAILVNDFEFLKIDSLDYKNYIDMILKGLEKALSE